MYRCLGVEEEDYEGQAGNFNGASTSRASRASGTASTDRGSFFFNDPSLQRTSEQMLQAMDKAEADPTLAKVLSVLML